MIDKNFETPTLSLRDKIAIEAMKAAIIASGDVAFFKGKSVEQLIPEKAYAIADGMLKAREVKQ